MIDICDRFWRFPSHYQEIELSLPSKYRKGENNEEFFNNHYINNNFVMC